jgi:hypothetical protein
MNVPTFVMQPGERLQFAIDIKSWMDARGDTLDTGGENSPLLVTVNPVVPGGLQSLGGFGVNTGVFNKLFVTLAMGAVLGAYTVEMQFRTRDGRTKIIPFKIKGKDF